jgi:hypothetical protein
VYQVNKPGSPEGRAGAFASSTAAGYNPAYAFDGSTSAWNCGSTQLQLANCFIGYDYGFGAARDVRSVRLQWITGSTTPKSIRIEHSDDGTAWSEASTIEVADYPSSAQNFRFDEYRIASQGRHRYWRVVPAQASHNQFYFGVAEVTFLERE